jgi:hypothetical protein
MLVNLTALIVLGSIISSDKFKPKFVIDNYLTIDLLRFQLEIHKKCSSLPTAVVKLQRCQHYERNSIQILLGHKWKINYRY